LEVIRILNTLSIWLIILACTGCPSGDIAQQEKSSDGRHAEVELDGSIWGQEKLAQEHERALVELWDALLAETRRGDLAAKAGVLASVELEQIRLGSPVEVETLDHEITRSRLNGSEAELSSAQWSALVHDLASKGYELVQSEWHHARFEPASETGGATSRVAIVLHLVDRGQNRRLIVDGEIDIEWSGRRNSDGVPIAGRIDATALQLLERAGPAGFERLRTYETKRHRKRSQLHPVVVYDLDGDGLSEIAMLGAGRVLWNRGSGEFEERELFEHPYELSEAGLIADLNGDGHPDLFASRSRGDLVVYFGEEGGRFASEPKVTPRFAERLRGPAVMTAGDVDGDGDLDVWLAQYKPPYIFGQMPTPFYDANDGWPAHMLTNDGTGRFTSTTEAAGLTEKRHRRTYASSLIDLDDDDDLDLVVISDFSGIDIHHNDGRGVFTDANETISADRHLFGMSSSYADFDLDGRLDLFVAGMASTTARRLEAAGLNREDRPDDAEMRMRMGYGNRMYVGHQDGWQEPTFHAAVARTGWTWGTTAFDFDNDGDFDLFAANGNSSGESTKDYCANFWCRDIYEGDSEPDEEREKLFMEGLAGLAAGTESWDGYQKNNLLMNRRGRDFVNVAFLMGVADEFDSRSAISEDIDLDGRVDLIVVEDMGIDGQRLHIHRNVLEAPGRWIGVQLREEGHGRSPLGASIRVRTTEGTLIRHVTAGDSLMGQHSTNVHFGLGSSARVETIEVRWIDGESLVLDTPEPGRYHLIDSAAGDPQADSQRERPAAASVPVDHLPANRS